MKPYVKFVPAEQEDVAAAKAAAEEAAAAAAVTTLPTTQPSSPKEGQMYFDKTNSKLMIYNGSAWKGVTVA